RGGTRGRGGLGAPGGQCDEEHQGEEAVHAGLRTRGVGPDQCTGGPISGEAVAGAPDGLAPALLFEDTAAVDHLPTPIPGRGRTPARRGSAMSEQTLYWLTCVGALLLAIFCLPVPSITKFVLEVSAWGLRLALLALLAL